MNSQVKGIDGQLRQQIDEFENLSQLAKQNAVVFVKHLFPQTEEAMGLIKDIVSDLEGWENDLDGLRERLDGGVEKCKEMIHLYEALEVEFNRCEDEANKDNRLKKLNGLVTTFANKEEKYRQQTREHDDWAQPSLKSVVLAIPTFGLSIAIANSLSERSKKKGDEKEQDKESATELAHRSENLLLPAIKGMKGGIRACCDFLIATKRKVIETKGKKGVGAPSRKFFQVMQQGAKEIALLHDGFEKKASTTRTNLKTIKYEQSDITYADQWMREKKDTFEKGGW